MADGNRASCSNSTGGGTAPHIDLSIFASRGPCPRTADPMPEGPDGARVCGTDDMPTHVGCAHNEVLALAQSKPNKGLILTKSVEYVKHLHEVCEALRAANGELHRQIDTIRQAVLGGQSLSPLSSRRSGEPTAAVPTATTRPTSSAPRSEVDGASPV